jgi:hypothetical protein
MSPQILFNPPFLTISPQSNPDKVSTSFCNLLGKILLIFFCPGTEGRGKGPNNIYLRLRLPHRSRQSL